MSARYSIGEPMSDLVHLLPTPSAVEVAGLSASNVDADTVSYERRNDVDVTNVTSDVIALQMVGDGALGLLLAVMCLTTVVGNALVIHAVRTDRKLQTVSNMFIVSLAVADLSVGLVVMPISAVYVLAARWPFGLAVCQLWLAADYTASTASILNLLVLSADRYCSVVDPLHYGLQRRTVRRAAATIVGVWSASALWVVPIVGWHVAFDGGRRTVPDDECDTEYAENSILKVVTALVNYFVPLGVMVVLYGRIFSVVRRRRSEIETWRRVRVVRKTDTVVIQLRSVAELNETRCVNPGKRDDDSAEDEGTPAAGGGATTPASSRPQTLLVPSVHVGECDDDVTTSRRHRGASSPEADIVEDVDPDESPTRSISFNAIASAVEKALHRTVRSAVARRRTIESLHGNYDGLVERKTMKLLEVHAPPKRSYRKWSDGLLLATSPSNFTSSAKSIGSPPQRQSVDGANRKWRTTTGDGLCAGEWGYTLDSTSLTKFVSFSPSPADGLPKSKSLDVSAAPNGGADNDDVSNRTPRTSKDPSEMGLRVIVDSSPSNVWSPSVSTERCMTSVDDLPPSSVDDRNNIKNDARPVNVTDQPSALGPLLRFGHTKPDGDELARTAVSPVSTLVTFRATSGCNTTRAAASSSLSACVRRCRSSEHDDRWRLPVLSTLGIRRRLRRDGRHLHQQQLLQQERAKSNSVISNGRASSSTSSTSTALSSDVKAARQLGVIVLAFCACFLPYFVCFVVVAFCRECVGVRLMTAVTWIGYVNSTLNPFLYPLCNRQFRDCFRRMFGHLAVKLMCVRFRSTSRAPTSAVVQAGHRSL